jgi:hypothetical protein
MKTIEARITKNIKEDPSIEECDIWNIEATFLEPLPDDAMRITADPKADALARASGSHLLRNT